MNAIRDAKQVENELKEFVGTTLSALAKRKPQLEPDDARQEFQKFFDEPSELELKRLHDERNAAIAQFTESVQQKLLDETLTVVARDGLAVAVGLLKNLEDEMVRAADQLRQDRSKLAQKRQSMLDGAAQVYANLHDKITGSAAPHREAGVYRYKALLQEAEVGATSDAEHLLREGVSALVAPLAKCLDSLAESLAAERLDPAGAGAVASKWAAGERRSRGPQTGWKRTADAVVGRDPQRVHRVAVGHDRPDDVRWRLRACCHREPPRSMG